jgi:hypothetical protein
MCFAVVGLKEIKVVLRGGDTWRLEFRRAKLSEVRLRGLSSGASRGRRKGRRLGLLLRYLAVSGASRVILFSPSTMQYSFQCNMTICV